ncbi:12208_t:CDS:2 [Ambispora leptoticha]|uniref:Geranylgeranyl transferase type-2 subunit alpha n=1 Tax=Ambispora leptoticha TaxID=144679 RepID=A0A9N9AS24_9GLOM|nr:12208_t:CDS:2 [Ambispora leptoticha]
MHGRKRVKPSAEVERQRKEKEAAKIKEYSDLVDACLNKKDSKKFDTEAFNYTTKILSQNPDFYTIWNFRRNILIYGLLKDADTDQKQEAFSNELVFLQALFQLNPKSYWIFNHRRWSLDNMPYPDWQRELELVGKILELDSRNFHGWDYRRYVTSKLSTKMANTDDENNNYSAESLTESEFKFTTTKINQNFSNYSAWHQRSKLLPSLFQEKNMTDAEKKSVIDEEFDLVKSAIYTDPDDQSAWLYHLWLVGREIRHISVLGAYFDPRGREIVLSFDDEIGMLSPFLVSQGNDTTDNNRKVQGNWRPAGGIFKHDQLNSDRLYGFVWIFTLTEDISTSSTLTVTIEPSSIVPSHSEARLMQTIEKSVINILNTDNIAMSTQSKSVDVEPSIVPAPETLPAIAQERADLLKREINVIKELLDLEPDRCLQTLISLLNELKYASLLESNEANLLNDEIVSYCDRLIKIDSLRIIRFEDLRSKAIFEKETASLVQGSLEDPKTIIYNQTTLANFSSQSSSLASLSLSSKNLTFIPTPSILLLLSKLDLSHNKLTSMSFLANLINLREVNLESNLILRIDGVRELRVLKEMNLKNNLISTFEAVRDGLLMNDSSSRDFQEKLKIHLTGNPLIADNISTEFHVFNDTYDIILG